MFKSFIDKMTDIKSPFALIVMGVILAPLAVLLATLLEKGNNAACLEWEERIYYHPYCVEKPEGLVCKETADPQRQKVCVERTLNIFRAE